MKQGFKTLYVTRISDNEQYLLLSEYGPETVEGVSNKVFFPSDAHCIDTDMFIPNLFPDLTWEDGPQRVVSVDCCEEETGLYLTVSDKDRLLLWNVHPLKDKHSGKVGDLSELLDNRDRRNEPYPYEPFILTVDNSLCPLTSVGITEGEVKNVKLVLTD